MAASATSAAGGALGNDDTSRSPSRPQSDHRLPIVGFLAVVDAKVVASLSPPPASSEDTTRPPLTSGRQGASDDDGVSDGDGWGPARLSVLVAHMHIAGCAPSPELLAASERALAAHLGTAPSPSPASRRRASSRLEPETNAPAWSLSMSFSSSPLLEASREARLILSGLMEMVSLPRGKCGPTATLAATRLMDRLQSLPPDVLLDALRAPSISSGTDFGVSSDSDTVPLSVGSTGQPSAQPSSSSSSSMASAEDPLAPFYSTMGISPPPQRRQGFSRLRSDGLSRSPATLPAGGAQPLFVPPPLPPRALVSMLEMMAGWGHWPSSHWLAGLVSGAVQRHLKGEAPMAGIHLLALLRVVALLQVRVLACSSPFHQSFMLS